MHTRIERIILKEQNSQRTKNKKIILPCQQIAATVNGRFGKYARNFKINIKEIVLQAHPIWEFEFFYDSLLKDFQQTVSDGTERGNINGILERVWLSLLADAQNSADKHKTEVLKQITQTGTDMGFIAPEFKRRYLF